MRTDPVIVLVRHTVRPGPERDPKSWLVRLREGVAAVIRAPTNPKPPAARFVHPKSIII
jgi:hypothetical protein